MRALQFLRSWLQAILTTVAVLAAIWLGAQYGLHLRLLAVQTGSMKPVFNPGDALIIQKLDVAHIHVGEIVSYKSARNPRELITHRVVRIDQKNGSFQTKGDRLSAPDPAVRDSLLVGRVITILPGLGGTLSWFRGWPALIICVYIPAFAMLVSELRRLERYYRHLRPYRLPGHQVV